MSRREWEEGTIKLPAAEFARVRQAVADAVTKRNQNIYDKAQEFWKTLTPKQKRDHEAYVKAFESFEHAHTTTTWHKYGGSEAKSKLPAELAEAIGANRFGLHGKPIARLKKEDLDFPTNRDTTFHGGSYSDGTLDFDRSRNTVTWTVSEGNHAVDHARGSDIWEAFDAAMSKVKWTRGTGGSFSGNDEYNQESRESGYGGNYTTAGYGPLGAVEAPGSTPDFTMADGTRVQQSKGDFEKLAKAQIAARKREWKKATAANQQGRVSRGIPQGGQFTNRYRPDADFRL